jgi:hypothetical protein
MKLVFLFWTRLDARPCGSELAAWQKICWLLLHEQGAFMALDMVGIYLKHVS